MDTRSELFQKLDALTSALKSGGGYDECIQKPSDMQARLLMDAAAKLAETFDKQIGILLTLKRGLGHLYKLEIGQVVILTQVFDRPLDNLSEGAGGSHYHRKSDIAIMHWDEENGAIEVAVDSRFFEPYTGEIA